MFKFVWVWVAGLMTLASGGANATNAPMLDCPMRDAPFSLVSPLYDVLINVKARAVLESHFPDGVLAKFPAIVTQTELPSFATIMEVRALGGMAQLKVETLDSLDAALRALPITDADRVKRCARYDSAVPDLVVALDRPNLLVFDKIIGFKHESYKAANNAVAAIAQRKGWHVQFTQSGGAFNPATLKKFDAVLWNNVSGDVLTLSQRAAFQDYLEKGGGYAGLHGAAGDVTYFWDWYPDTLIGARFAGHPIDPPYQETRVMVNEQHFLAEGLPTEWLMTEEWYAFKTNPKLSGAKVLLSLDESMYSQTGFVGEDISMGGDHPIAWTKCIGKGRMFYNGIGHKPETYSHPINVRVIENGLSWALNAKNAC